MPECNSELTAIVLRLERVEKENRRLKRAFVTILVLALALLAMGQARSKRTVEAERFVLRDGSGVIRATLGVEPRGGALLTMYGPQGNNRKDVIAEIGVGSTGVAPAELSRGDLGGFVHLGSPKAGANTLLDSSGLTFSDEASDPRLTLSTDSGGALLFFGSQQKAEVALFGGHELLGLNLFDKDGYSIHVGRTDLVMPRTGEKRKTSAASLVMLGNGGKVIWSAP